MRMRGVVPVIAGVVALAAATAQAEPVKLRDLLAQGFEIKAMTVIPQDVAQRMANSTGWRDDLMVSLQRGNELAFCHVTLDATLAEGTQFLDSDCRVQR